MWWFSLAGAATLTVGPGQSYASVGAAINAASSGDTIEIHAGTYTVRSTVTRDLHFVGVGTVVLRSSGGLLPMLDVQAAATFDNLVFDGLGSATCLQASTFPGRATLDVTDSVFQRCSLGIYAVDGVTLHVVHSLFRDDVQGLVAEGVARVERSGFVRDDFGADVGRYGVFVGNAFVDTVHASISIHDLHDHRVLENVFCNGGAYGAIDAEVFDGDPTAVALIQGNRFLANHGTSSAALDIDNHGYGGITTVNVVGNTFVDNGGPVAAHLRAKGVAVALLDDLFALGDGAAPALVAEDGRNYYGQPLPGSISGDYLLFWSNAGGDLGGSLLPGDLGSHTLWGTDPLFGSYVADADCSDDLELLPGSPAIDAGDPGLTDHRDGSRADIGWVPYR